MHFRSVALWLGVALSAMVASPLLAQVSPLPESTQATPINGPFGIIATVAGDGWGGFYGDGGLATKAELHDPLGVAVDSAGDLYIADTDNNVIRKVSAATGDISTVAGTLEAGYAGDKGPATKALLFWPTAVALDSDKNLYIADSANNAIRKVSAATGIITTVAGDGYGAGPFHECGSSGDGGPATSAELCFPQGVAVDAKGNIYVSDTGNGLIREVNAKTNAIATVAGNATSGLDGFFANQNPATSVLLKSPLGITVDGSGNFYFADPEFCVVWEVTASTGIIGAVAGDFQCAAGQDGVKATSTSMESLTSVAVDAAGNLYVAGNTSQLVRRVDAKTGEMTTAAGAVSNPSTNATGAPGYFGDGGPASSAALDDPYGVAAGHSGNLYIADSFNNAIREVTATTAATTPAPVASPATPASGLGFGSTEKVLLEDADSAAAIYYTTDGTVPTTSSTRYTGPIQLAKTATITAFAAAPGVANSNAVGDRYVLLPAPKISPNGGAFSTPQTVTLSDSLQGLSFSYTTDGSDPTVSFTAQFYFGPFQVSKPATLKAVAELNGGYGSVSTAQFVIPTAPAVTTGAATKIGSSTATLNGTVNPGDLATKYWFNYSANCGTALETPQTALAASVATENVSANLTGLAKGTEYCITLFATNSKGTNSGLRSFFSTTN